MTAQTFGRISTNARQTAAAGLLSLTGLLLLGGPIAAAGTAALEDFEAGIPATWDILEAGTGSVSVDSTHAHSGDYSLLSDPGTISGWAGIMRSDFVSAPKGLVLAHFYDDMGGCANGPGKAQLVSISEDAAYPSSVRGVGVNSGVSACTYVHRIDGFNLPTLIPRTAGWHEFSFRWDGTSMVVKIDEIPVSADPYGFQPDKVGVGNFWLGSPTGPAWYDDVTYIAG